MRDKYISVKQSVSGFSFANLGLFVGFGDGVSNAVYSLVLLNMLTLVFGQASASAAVGIYVALYSLFCMFVGFFSNETFRIFSKSKLLYMSILAYSICYAMMSFSIKPISFFALDYASSIGYTFIMMLIPLFMADFSKKVGMAKLNARYHLWVNIGALVAPMFAVTISNYFGNYQTAFLAVALIYFSGLLFFKHFGIVQQEKVIKVVKIRKVLRALHINAISFFRTEGMARAYIVNFGYYALRAMRLLYVPIVVIESGFSNDTLGIVLTLGIIPYIVMGFIIGRLVERFGVKLLMSIGLISFSVFSIGAMMLSGKALLVIFVLWQISGSCMESVHDLLFFNKTKKIEQSKFYGVFRTSSNLPNVIAPFLGALCIAIFGNTSAVWMVTASIGILSAIVLLSKK